MDRGRVPVDADVAVLGPGVVADVLPVPGVTRPGVVVTGDPAPFSDDIELLGVRPVGGFLRVALRSLLPSSMKIRAVK